MANGRRHKIFKVLSELRVLRDQMEVMARTVQMEKVLPMHHQLQVQQDLQVRKVKKV
jgi:hypothetical protein